MEIRPIIRKVLRADGTEEELQGPLSLPEVAATIGALSASVAMEVDRHHIMLVDCMGEFKNLPINHAATAFYRAQQRTESIRRIVGDAVIVPVTDLPLT